MIYFNEFDDYPAKWLANLFPDATIDARSITDVRASDTNDYLRCHFFAGIGGWELALRLAGWDDGREVWTGSCPCQPFSVAGNKKGTSDKRHLWPEFLRLIAERRPATIFGEQVASPAGREWLAGVRVDLEALGYAVGAADLCAAGVAAPHIRQRLFWVATLTGSATNGDIARKGVGGRASGWTIASESVADSVGDPRREGRTEHEGREGIDVTPPPGGFGNASNADLADAGNRELQRSGGLLQPQEDPFAVWGDTAVVCADGKARRIEPTILPLAHGIPNRVGRIRAYGNAIVPQIAAQFIAAFLETEK